MRVLLLGLFSVLLPAWLYGQEICDNGIDDDADGLIDLNDPDCKCSGILTGVTSLIPNPSFEDTLCCPSTFSQLDCAVGWIQASTPTTDYFNLCDFTHIGGFFSPPSYPLPGGGNGYAGFYNYLTWQEMIGACLDEPLEANNSYRFSFFLAKATPATQSIVVSIYGTPDCNDLPWDGNGCPVGIGSWMLLAQDSVTLADSSWQQTVLQFIPPDDIHALAIGGPCTGVPLNITNYFYIDELVVASSAEFDFNAQLTETGKWCSNDLKLHAGIDTVGGSWQWYKDGVALAGEVTDSLDLMRYDAVSLYSAVYSLGGDCISLDHTVDTTDPANRPRELLILNQDTTVCKGDIVPVRAQATRGYSFLWSPVTGINDPTLLMPEITVDTDTSVFYTLTASYPGCPDTSMGFRIRMEYVNVDFGPDTMVCKGDFVPLSAHINPYRPDYKYAWSPADGLEFDSTANNYFRADSSITYRLQVSTPIGCSGIDSIHIDVLSDSFATAISDTGYCPPDAIPLWAEGGSSYRWAPAYGLDDSSIARPLASPATSTTYSVYVTNDYGCRDTQQVFIDVYPRAVLHMPDTVRIYPGERYHVKPGTNCHYFNWTPTSGISGLTVADPVFHPEVRTRYFVTARTEQGCEVQDSIDVLVEGTVLDMPNAFVPGKGSVPVLKPAKRGLASLVTFTVYNRWGNQVFSTTNIDEGWDGSYKGQPQPTGVYVYQVEAITVGGQRIRKEGDVTLLR